MFEKLFRKKEEKEEKVENKGRWEEVYSTATTRTETYINKFTGKESVLTQEVVVKLEKHTRTGEKRAFVYSSTGRDSVPVEYIEGRLGKKF